MPIAPVSVSDFMRGVLLAASDSAVRALLGATQVGATAPASVGSANAAGASADAARVDHVHNHGTHATGDTHPVYLLADGTRVLTGNLDFSSNGFAIGSGSARPTLYTGPRFPKVVEVAASYPIAAGDEIVLADPTAGAFPVTLPAIGVGNRGRVFTVKHSSSSGNAVTVTPTGADTIDGAVSVVRNAYQVARLLCPLTGTDWKTL